MAAAEHTVIPIICGPTASGKTSLALQYSQTHQVEIVSADSRQIIRRLDIGTAKPTPEELRMAPFHLVDIIDPGERYSAYRFIVDASRAIGGILERGHIPLVVGGTGLYLRALTDGVVEIDSDDMAVREELEEEVHRDGLPALYEQLQRIDPLEAAKTHPHNKKRILRALEIFRTTGKSKSELVTTGTYKRGEYDFEYYCLAPPRELLYERINNRVDEMMRTGLPGEVERLVAEGLQKDVRAANVIGYNELLDFLDNRLSLEEAVSLIKQNTRRYAKRQMTWFRGQKDCRFFPDDASLKQALSLPDVDQGRVEGEKT